MCLCIQSLNTSNALLKTRLQIHSAQTGLTVLILWEYDTAIYNKIIIHRDVTLMTHKSECKLYSLNKFYYDMHVNFISLIVHMIN
jgi:hypothetical protein